MAEDSIHCAASNASNANPATTNSYVLLPGYRSIVGALVSMPASAQYEPEARRGSTRTRGEESIRESFPLDKHVTNRMLQVARSAVWRTPPPPLPPSRTRMAHAGSKELALA